MVIVLVIDTFGVHNNGTTISAGRFASELSQSGHEIRIVTCGDPAKSGVDPGTGYAMYYTPELYVPVASALAHKQHTLFAKPVRRVLREATTGADVVHIYEPFWLGRGALRMARRLGVPALAAFHIQPENITYNTGFRWFSPAVGLIYHFMRVLFYGRFRHIHCPSMFIATQLRRHGYKAWLHVISNGVHPDFCPGKEKKPHPDGLFRILMVGRLSPEKRQDVLIRAVAQSKCADRIQLYFAGSGPWEKKLRAMGESLPHPPVFGYCNKPQLIELMRSCDLYVHTSDVEIEGISCIEAFACGLTPVISDSSRSATGQFAREPENLFRAGDPASLASRIEYWVDHPDHLREAGEKYARYAREYSLRGSVRRMERVYAELCGDGGRKRNPYQQPGLFSLLTRLFYTGIASPLLFLYTQVVLGMKIEGIENLRGVMGALTLCNHVHQLDSALVGLAFFPRKMVFPTQPGNLKSLWPGQMVRLLGGVEVPQDRRQINLFFDEMEYLLRKGRVVHFFPEGDLHPYDTRLREFKRGAFYLAARARVPLVPMSISFHPPEGLRKLFRKKPVMTLHIGKPIYPVRLDPKEDAMLRMEAARKQMSELLHQGYGEYQRDTGVS